MVVLSEVAIQFLFVKISICDALLQHDLFNDIIKRICHTVTQGIRTSKTFIKYESATTDKFITKHKYTMSNVEITETK